MHPGLPHHPSHLQQVGTVNCECVLNVFWCRCSFIVYIVLSPVPPQSGGEAPNCQGKDGVGVEVEGRTASDQRRMSPSVPKPPTSHLSHVTPNSSTSSTGWCLVYLIEFVYSTCLCVPACMRVLGALLPVLSQTFRMLCGHW